MTYSSLKSFLLRFQSVYFDFRKPQIGDSSVLQSDYLRPKINFASWNNKWKDEDLTDYRGSAPVVDEDGETQTANEPQEAQEPQLMLPQGMSFATGNAIGNAVRNLHRRMAEMKGKGRGSRDPTPRNRFSREPTPRNDHSRNNSARVSREPTPRNRW